MEEIKRLYWYVVWLEEWEEPRVIGVHFRLGRNYKRDHDRFYNFYGYGNIFGGGYSSFLSACGKANYIERD